MSQRRVKTTNKIIKKNVCVFKALREKLKKKGSNKANSNSYKSKNKNTIREFNFNLIIFKLKVLKPHSKIVEFC